MAISPSKLILYTHIDINTNNTSDKYNMVAHRVPYPLHTAIFYSVYLVLMTTVIIKSMCNNSARSGIECFTVLFAASFSFSLS